MVRWVSCRAELQALWFQARTQVLVWYGVLMVCSGVATILSVQHILDARLEDQVEKNLLQEVQEFRRLGYGDAQTAPFPRVADVQGLFDRFLSQNVPGDGEYFLTFWQGRFYKASARALPSPLQPTSAFYQYWARLTQSETGEFMTSVGPLMYWVEVVQGPAQAQGVLVIAQLTAGEQQEIEEVMWVMSGVTLLVLLITTVLGWVMLGRVLTPLSALSQAIRAIGATKLTERIAVQGKGEVADLAQRFNGMMNRLESAFVNQRQFMSDIGHELRTPLTIVRGHLELMGDEPQERRETLALVLDELERMSHLVDDLLLLARSERPDFLRITSVDLAALTEELYQKVQAIAPRQWGLDGAGVGQIWCDRHRVTEAVMNLAQNATQHTQEIDEVAIGSAITTTSVEIWVRDTGEGIAPAAQAQIFERFGRADNGRHHPDGLGLGLAIVQAIVHAHGGSVRLKSQPGTGSTFTLVIPLTAVLT
ncbi:HAMP domain-containing protein [Synechococcales cyanobacterium C]|uniref:histidine kinase n=1 Tax=Petrachloros mirabilis ULC683 TaxID=2781853 RepID=A0A8K2A7P3_9CYAN|nr:HAMP domain-containing sensor histidine kinase [Petrachloros mirabilis]NCJ06295.1 HAMP domain-containing protein [Petrachloros mirabilis ULC683]